MSSTGAPLAALAADLASVGIAGHDDELDAVIRTARARGVSPVLVGVLADPLEPEVARLRAFGAIATILAFGAPSAPVAMDRAAA